MDRTRTGTARSGVCLVCVPYWDISNLRKYRVRNTVTQIVPGRLIEWTVGFDDLPPIGRALEPVNETETDVTNGCDWSLATTEEMRSGVRWPVVPNAMLEQSASNLDRMVAGT
jgi:hypothetical protein